VENAVTSDVQPMPQGSRAKQKDLAVTGSAE